jgi:uncharacterized phage protein (TIGR01671 family)
MKEIKFRVWDKQLKVFLYQLPEKHHLEWERFDVQQYTGLTDKNEKNVYEKDIIKYSYPAGYSIAIVEFGYYDNGELYEDREAGYGWYIKKIFEYSKNNKEFYKQYNEVYVFHPKEYPLNSWEFEVIGNVFENPEKLQVEI